MQCWICSRQANGCCHSDHRFSIGDRRRYPVDWVFCSSRCQNAFHSLYGIWIRALDKNMSPENAVLNITPLEREAMRTSLKSFGAAASSIGFDKPLGAYSEAEALSVVGAIVSAYVDEMAAQHEQSKYPPVRMQGVKPVNDPIREPFGELQDLQAKPFADMENDLPWEIS
jgi:hypothetical protein